MEKPTATVLLKELILLKETQRKLEGELLKEHFRETYQSFKPANIIKSALTEVATSPNLKANFINAAIGLATGYLAKKIFIGKTNNPFSKLLGGIVELVVANKASANAEGIKSLGSMILQKLVHQKSEA